MRTIAFLIGILISLNLHIQSVYGLESKVYDVLNFQDKQYTIRGVVTNEDGNPLSNVNILLYNKGDSTHYDRGIVSNEDGEFLFKNLTLGTYKLLFSMIGFESQYREIQLDQSVITLDTLKMNEAVNPLEEVLVVSNTLEVLGEKNIKYFSIREKKRSLTALELMTNIPQIKIKASTNKLINQKAQNILILCNGSKIDELDLLAIRPEDVQKAIYYPDPPVKYLNSGYESVLLITTYPTKNKGGYIMANLENGFTTGYGTNILQGRYSSGENDYALRYFIDYRDLNKNRFSQSYRYVLDNDRKYDINKVGEDGIYSGQYHKIEASYSRNKNENYSFILKTMLFINPGHEDYPQLSSGIESSIPVEDKLSNLLVKTHYLSPVLDLYFSKQMKEKQKISFNMVNTYYNSKSDRSIKENVYDITTRLYSNSYSLIMEGEYEKTFQSGNVLSAGVRYFHKMMDEKYRLEGKQNDSNHYLSHNIYTYVDWSGQKDKLIYTVGLGAEENIQKTDTRLSSFVLKPLISLSYKINKVSSWKLRSSLSAYSPNISLLTNSFIYIEPTILSTGNPNLKSYYKTISRLSYLCNLSNFYMEISAYYDYAHRPYYPLYTNEGSHILKKYENIDNAQQIMGQFYLNWKALNFLDFSCYYEGSSQRVMINNSSYKHWYNLINIAVNLYYKDFSLEGMAIVKNKKLKGMLLEKDNNYYSVTLSWKKNNLRLSLGTLFMHDTQVSQTIPNTSIYYQETKSWQNFKGLTYLKLIYTLPLGKKVKQSMKRTLNNVDTDSGVFIDGKTKM